VGKQMRPQEASLLLLATRLYRAIGFAMPRLPEPTQAVFTSRLEDSDVRWALALLLAGWRLSHEKNEEAPGIAEIMKAAGAAMLLEQLDQLRAFLPEGFERFISAADEAGGDAQFAGAGAYLVAAVRALGEMQRNGLHGFLRSAPFQESGRALIRRFPEPGSSRPPVWGAPPPEEAAPKPKRRPGRGDRFDRADFARPRAERPAERRTPLAPPTAVLDDEAVTRAYLCTLGWEGSEVERLIVGPRSKRDA